MTPDEFAKTIKAKYPQYANIDNTILAKKIVEKYPIYASKVNFIPTTQDVYKQAGEKITNQITGQGEFAGQSAIQRGVGATATAFNTIPNVLVSQLPKTTQTGLASLGQKIGEKFSWLTDKIASTKLFSEIGNLEAQGYLNKDTAPELYRVKEALGTAVGGGEIAGNILLADQATKGLQKTSTFAQKEIPPVYNKVSGAVSETTGNIKNIITGKISGKTPAEILATPENDVYKLSKPERDFYKQNQTEALSTKFKNEQANIAQKHTQIETKVNADLEAKSQASTKQITDLSKEVDQTAYNKTTELKPKAVKAFGEQSNTYRTLREEDLAPYKDLPVNRVEVGNKLENAFPNSPEVAKDFQSKLNFDTNGNTTIGELDTQMKALRQDIGSAGRKGTRVYTPDEMNIDKALQSMSDLLKEKGVDLSRSNKFWREWAPLRDKIVAKLKPFDVGGYETKTFSKILIDSGKGDIHNTKFIKGVEDVLGEPITIETKTAMQKLSEAQKQQLTNKIDAEVKLEDARLAKEQALKESKLTQVGEARQLKIKQFEIERLAIRRAWIKRLIYTALGVAGYGEVRRFFPILP